MTKSAAASSGVVNTTSAAGQMAGCSIPTTVVVGAAVVGATEVEAALVVGAAVVVGGTVVEGATVVLTAVVDTLVALVDVVLSESSLHAANRPPTASTANTARNGEVMQTVSRI